MLRSISFLLLFLAGTSAADPLDFQLQFPATSSFIEDIDDAGSIVIEASFISSSGATITSRELNLKSGGGYFVGFTTFNNFPVGVDRVCSAWLRPTPREKWVLFDKCEKIDLSNVNAAKRPVYIDERGIDLFSSFVGQSLSAISGSLDKGSTAVGEMQDRLDDLLETANFEDFNRPFLIADAYARLIDLSLRSNSPLGDPWIYSFSTSDDKRALLLTDIISRDAPRKTGSGDVTVYSARVLFEAMLKASPSDLENYAQARESFIQDFFASVGFLAGTRATLVRELRLNPSIIALDFAAFCKDRGFPQDMLKQCLRSISLNSQALFGRIDTPLNAASSARIVAAVAYYGEAHAKAFSSCNPANPDQEDILCPFMLKRIVSSGICNGDSGCVDQIFPKIR